MAEGPRLRPVPVIPTLAIVLLHVGTASVAAVRCVDCCQVACVSFLGAATSFCVELVGSILLWGCVPK